MGTGKTLKLKELVEKYEPKTMVALSFRRTFANDFAHKNNIKNY
jgi:hypothetical protein